MGPEPLMPRRPACSCFGSIACAIRVVPSTKNGHELTPPAEIDESMAHWASLWDIPSLASRVSVEFSSRMTRSLGRCYPERSLIRLSEHLTEAPRSIFLEALCHELAHIAVHELNGGKTGPHGPAWEELMRVAGFEPRTRLRYLCSEAPIVKRRSQQRRLYVHHCPVCQMERIARRAVKRWRCSACIEAGLDGKLEIRRRPVRGIADDEG